MIYISKLIALTAIAVIVSTDYLCAQQTEQFQFDHKVIYEVTYLSDSLDQQSKNQIKAELLLSEEVSLFRSVEKAQSDAAYMEYITSNVITMSPPVVHPIGYINPFNYQVVKNLTSGQTKVYDDYAGSNLNNLTEINYYFEPEASMADWQLKSDTLTVNGHLCQRADLEFGGRKWTAWFSPELSEFTDGPYKFSGLPGLIFRVHDDKETWDFELVEFSKVDTLVAINFKEGLDTRETNKSQLYNDRRQFQHNQIDIAEASGKNYGDTRASVKNSLEEYILKDNNWIELDFE